MKNIIKSQYLPSKIMLLLIKVQKWSWDMYNPKATSQFQEMLISINIIDTHYFYWSRDRLYQLHSFFKTVIKIVNEKYMIFFWS